MAAITPTVAREPRPGGLHVLRYTGTGVANQADALNTGTAPAAAVHGLGGVRRVVYAACTYSASPTQAGVTFSIDSGAGTGFDTTLSTGSANAQYNVYSPDEEILLFSDDEFLVSAPAAGGVITASIIVVLEGV